MNFDVVKEIWADILHFFDRVMGWLNYTIGGAEDPYVYDGFWENIFGIHIDTSDKD